MADYTPDVTLPPGYDDAFGRALLEAVREELDSIDLTRLLVFMVDNVDAAALPFLGRQFAVMGYKGWLLATTETEQRELIKNAIRNHKRRGTFAGIRGAIAPLNYGLELSPWYEYGGQPKHFAVSVLDVSQKGLNAETLDLIYKLIDEWKSARDILDSINAQTSMTKQLYMGAAVTLHTVIDCYPGNEE